MAYQVEIRHAELKPIQFLCDGDQTLVAAAKAAGFLLATTCLRGGCGACRSEIVSGSVTALSPMSLTHCQSDDPELSYQLVCVAAPTSDLILEMVSPWQVRTTRPLSARLN